MLLNAAKFQDYSFTFSELLRENQQEGGERGLNYKIKNPRNEHEILTNWMPSRYDQNHCSCQWN